MLLIILVRGFCPLKIKILSPNFLVDSVLIHLIVAPHPPPPLPPHPFPPEFKTIYRDVLKLN